jgi:hypothetical protein
VRREAQLSKRMQLRKSNCPHNKGGVRARQATRLVAGQALPARREDAWGHAPRLAG